MLGLQSFPAYFALYLVLKNNLERKKFMKKKILPILLIILIITGCNKLEKSYIGEESTIEISTSNDVTLSLKDETLTDKGATIILTNNSKKEYSYSTPYTIEIKKDGKWHVINVNLDFTVPLYHLKPGEKEEIELNWENTYGKLKTGTYRIVKGIDYEYQKDKTKTLYLTTEFNIDSN